MYLFFKRFFYHGFIGKKVASALAAALALNLLFGSLFYLVERDAQKGLTYLDSLWWAMVTMTTVGYGDYYAQTLTGRFVISYVCMLLGIGIVGFFIGIIAEHIIETLNQTKKGYMKIFEKNHLLICNYSTEQKLLEMIDELQHADPDQRSGIVLIDEDLEFLPESLQKKGVQYVRGAPSHELVLQQANILECQGAIILVKNVSDNSSDESTYAIGSLIEMISKENNHPIKVVTEVLNSRNVKLMERSNVDGMVMGDGIISRMLIQEYLYPGLHEIFQQLFSNTRGSQFYIFPTKLVGFKVVDLQLEIIKNPLNIQIIGIIHEGKPILNPPKTLVIFSGDQLVLLAENHMNFKDLENNLLESSGQKKAEKESGK